MQFNKVERWRTYLKMSMTGASGFGKTYGALLLAKGLVGSWNKVGVIDTENGSSQLYEHLGEYNVLNLEAPYSPDRYVEALWTAVNAGLEVVIIDSTSHAWNGPGGALEMHDIATAAHPKQDSYASWASVTPLYNRFIETIKNIPIHVICTFRTSQEYVMEKSGDKTVIKKLGLQPETRKGSEYDFTVIFSVGEGNLFTVTKDRTEIFKDSLPTKITEGTGEMLRDWVRGAKDPIKAIDGANTTEALTALWGKLQAEAPQLLTQVDIIEAFKTKGKTLKQPSNDVITA